MLIVHTLHKVYQAFFYFFLNMNKKNEVIDAQQHCTTCAQYKTHKIGFMWWVSFI
jgi:hypothetical protein